MSNIRVYNKHYESPKEPSVYIGRPSKWGNPFSHLKNTKAEFKVADREEAVSEYKHYILNNKALLEDLHELKGKSLVCWCKPAPCHGDILLELANAIEPTITKESDSIFDLPSISKPLITDKPTNDFIALVGTREGLSEEQLEAFRTIGELVVDKGYGISSGDAVGSDRAFWEGARNSIKYKDLKHRIYLVDFLGNRTNRIKLDEANFIDASKLPLQSEVVAICNKVINHYSFVKPFVKRLFERNVNQILGDDLKTPVKALIYYSEPFSITNETVKGGTNVALQIAKHYNIEYRLNLFGKTPKDMISAVEDLLLKLDPKETIEIIRIGKDSSLIDSVNIDLDNDIDFCVPEGDFIGDNIKKYNDKIEATINNNKVRWLELLELDKLIILEPANKNYFNLFLEHLRFTAYIYNKEINYDRPEFDN